MHSKKVRTRIPLKKAHARSTAIFVIMIIWVVLRYIFDRFNNNSYNSTGMSIMDFLAVIIFFPWVWYSGIVALRKCHQCGRRPSLGGYDMASIECGHCGVDRE